MPALIGILLDFSNLMKETVYDKIDKKDGKRSRSIFKVIDDLIIKENILPENKCFAMGFGLRGGLQTVDIIGTIKMIKQFHEKYAKYDGKPEYSTIVQDVYRILEDSGAKSIKKRLSEEVIKNRVPYYLLALILDALESSTEFRSKVISCLPDICRADSRLQKFTGAVKHAISTKKDVDTIVRNIQKCFFDDKNLMKRVLKEETSEFSFDVAADAFRYWFEGKTIDDDKIKQVLKMIDPFVYGENNLYNALDKSIEIFQKSEFSHFKKYLFVLSDGIAKDSGDLTLVKDTFEKTDVKVISCFVSSLVTIEPKRLYDSEGDLEDFGAKFMFKLSSKIKTEILPYMIFEKLGWSIDQRTNETKLFLQVNHPDHIHEACTLAKKLIYSHDALLDFLGTITLSSYTRNVKKSLSAPTQDGGTCYANAVAAALHLAMKRILNRSWGYPRFFRLRKKIIDAFGKQGADVATVLETFCSKHRLQYNKIDGDEALTAITCSRPVITTFYLTEKEWDSFSDFFEKNPTGVLSKKEIDISKRASSDSDKICGHAVILMSFNSECLRFMNSWGDKWGDMGFFRVQNKEVLNLEYYDVYWTENNLSKKEKECYAKNGVTAAKTIVEKLRNIKSATFLCPKCKDSSPVCDFRGTFNDVKCPKCFDTFVCEDEGTTLAMNLYLTSLLR